MLADYTVGDVLSRERRPLQVPVYEKVVQVPCIHVLADHNAIDPHIPHFGGTVSAGL